MFCNSINDKNVKLVLTIFFNLNFPLQPLMYISFNCLTPLIFQLFPALEIPHIFLCDICFLQFFCTSSWSICNNQALLNFFFFLQKTQYNLCSSYKAWSACLFLIQLPPLSLIPNPKDLILSLVLSLTILPISTIFTLV